MQHRRRSRGEDAYIIWTCLHPFNMARRGGEVVRWKTWQGRYLLFMCAREAAQRANNKVTSGMIRWGRKASLASHPIEPLTSAGALVQPGGGAVPFPAELRTAACAHVLWMSSQRWQVHSSTSVWRAALKKVLIAKWTENRDYLGLRDVCFAVASPQESWALREDGTDATAYRPMVGYWINKMSLEFVFLLMMRMKNISVRLRTMQLMRWKGRHRFFTFKWNTRWSETSSQRNQTAGQR